MGFVGTAGFGFGFGVGAGAEDAAGAGDGAAIGAPEFCFTSGLVGTTGAAVVAAVATVAVLVGSVGLVGRVGLAVVVGAAVALGADEGVTAVAGAGDTDCLLSMLAVLDKIAGLAPGNAGLAEATGPAGLAGAGSRNVDGTHPSFPFKEANHQPLSDFSRTLKISPTLKLRPSADPLS